MTKRGKICLIALLVLELFVLIYFGYQKKGMHFDEFFSYFNTNDSFGREAYDRSWVTSENIKKDFYVLPGEGFNYGRVITLQSYDVHPPFYYILLHTVCSFMPGVYSMWQGIGLNILLALLILVFLYLIIDHFAKDEILSLLSLLCIILNPGFISNVMFIRMYMLLTLWFVIQVYVHLLMSSYEDLSKMPKRYVIISAVVTYLGFLTHYYYLVFLFFLELGFFAFRLKKIKTEFMTELVYFGSLLLSGVMGVITFPACLGQVNSGYRGVEVKGYLTDLSDLGDRLRFFGGLVGRFVLNGIGVLIFILLILFAVTAYYRSKSIKYDKKMMVEFFCCAVIPVLGFFVFSAKGSLIGDEAMMRYQLPVYPLIIFIILVTVYSCIRFGFENNKKLSDILRVSIALIFIISDIFSLFKGEVFYLYPEQGSYKQIATEHSEETCMYIYNSEYNKYFIWSDADQLWQYDKIYFADFENKDEIVDPAINSADKLIVYISKLNGQDSPDEYIDMIKRSDPKVTSYEKLYETTYATAYEFY
ncbi:MAG: hypothetical protein K6A38_03070 [Lachnospiraceae bacterium]|nr:hypothetical protein [Lachnospiraceae bacterium]